MSFRQTRLSYLASFFKSPRIKRSKRKSEQREQREQKPAKVYAKRKRWDYAAPLPGVSGHVLGFTRSHARAEIKLIHGLKTTAGIGLLLKVA